jgi:hypothetical protein
MGEAMSHWGSSVFRYRRGALLNFTDSADFSAYGDFAAAIGQREVSPQEAQRTQKRHIKPNTESDYGIRSSFLCLLCLLWQILLNQSNHPDCFSHILDFSPVSP